MSTPLSNCETELSKQLGDYFASTTTSAGDTGGLHLTDTALAEKEDDWVTDNTYDQITSGTYGYATTYDGEERKVKSLANENGTLGLVRAHTGQIATSVTYRVHRLFSASDKRRALIWAAKHSFPHIFAQVRDENLTVGNWLRDPSLEWNWSSTTANTYWINSGLTMTKSTSYYTRGSLGAALSGSTGYMCQSDTQNPDLLNLAGKTVTFKCKAWCDTASALRLGICYDGTHIEYGDYHPGTSNWADESGYGGLADFLWVQKQIDYDPTAVSFRVYYTTGATAYVDDLRVIGPTRDKLYIGDLDLAQNRPHSVSQSHDTCIYDEPWQPLSNYSIDKDGYLWLPEATQDYRLRVEGIGYLDFLVSGASSTTWAATIDIDEPQLQILVAQAAIYLCNQMIIPSETPSTTSRWERALAYWTGELTKRRNQFRMQSPSATKHTGV